MARRWPMGIRSDCGCSLTAVQAGGGMRSLHRRTFAGLLQMLVGLPILIFLPAWTLSFWQGWLCLAVFCISVIAITFYLMERDPKLLERRLSAGAAAEKRKAQKIGQVFGAIVFITLFAIPGLDHRFGWSHVPALAAVAGDVLIAAGFVIVFLVFRVNTYTSGIIEIAEGQQFVSSGPYAAVRHPMYSGSLIMLLGIPLALGSWWGMLLIFPMAAVLVARIFDEENFLTVSLAGYADYQRRIKYRLAPLIW
jgi:protein-S-isoprenylcysteine O-methyltransferase Ste14